MNLKTLLRLSASMSFLIVALLNAGGATADSAVQGQAAPSAAITTILPPKEAETLFKVYFNADYLFGKQDRHHRLKETYKMPDAADVAQLETDFAAYAQSPAYATYAADLKRRGMVHAISLTSYCRQYAGITRGNKKFILINGFTPSFASWLVTAPINHRKGSPINQKRGLDWHDQAVIVDDGGPAFFHAVYDPASHQIKDFTFNGIA